MVKKHPNILTSVTLFILVALAKSLTQQLVFEA